MRGIFFSAPQFYTVGIQHISTVPCLIGTDEEHITYCFDIYDLNGDGMISREEMLTMLKTSLGRQGLDEDPDEGVKVGKIQWTSAPL